MWTPDPILKTWLEWNRTMNPPLPWWALVRRWRRYRRGLKYSKYVRYSYGWSDWKWVYGTEDSNRGTDAIRKEFK